MISNSFKLHPFVTDSLKLDKSYPLLQIWSILLRKQIIMNIIHKDVTKYFIRTHKMKVGMPVSKWFLKTEIIEDGLI